MKVTVALLCTFCFVVLIQALEAPEKGVHIKPIVNDHLGKRIIGGADANWKKSPWLAKNVCRYPGTNSWVTCGCGSTMITPEWAVTAGHCAGGPYNYSIGLMFSDGDVIEIKKQVRPPNWSYDSLNTKFVTGTVSESIADIGLQKLKRPIKLCTTKQILDILLYRNKDLGGNLVGISGTLLGWGAINESQVFDPAPFAYASKLQTTQDNILSNDYCQQIVDIVAQANTGKPSTFRFNSSLFCAAPPGIVFNPAPSATLGGLCRGDSGGPLFQTKGWIFPRVDVLGFVTDTMSLSLDRPCGNGIDIYTRLTPAYLDWLRYTIAKDAVLPNH